MRRSLARLAAPTVLALWPLSEGDLRAQERTPAPTGAEVYFISPEDGARVAGPITVRFGLRKMGIAPAGVEHEGTGHHHLIIDADPPPVDEPIASEEQYRHFGGGQSEAIITLPPGAHTLQLLLGDHNHTPHDPPVMSQRITIHVD